MGAEGFHELLSAAGVDASTLGDAERRALAADGYVVLEGVLASDALDDLRATFERLAAESPSPRSESGTRHVALPLGADPRFDPVIAAPRLLAAVDHVLARPFRLDQGSGRDPEPGFGLQGLHADWMPRVPGDAHVVATALFLLDAFTAENGATSVVPGSHVFPGPVPKSYAAPDRRHPDERRVVAPAGSVLVLNGHLWHRGTRNDSSGPRRVWQCIYRAAERFGPASVGPPIAERVEGLGRFLLGR